MPPPSDLPIDPVADRLLASRTELLDLSLRNPLLNYRGSARRGVEIVGEDATQVFAWLVDEGRPMRFHATREGGQPSPVSDEPDARDNSLATPYTAETLRTRLQSTWYDAWLSIQERGCNTLFLALGMLRWREAAGSTVDRYAPLVLLPVRLSRTSVRNAWSLTLGDDDPGANISLAEKLREFGVRAPEAVAFESASDFTAYLDAWDAAISGQAGWAVERGRLGLAFFSFSRFLMWRDLDPAQWPTAHQPSAHPLVRGLLAEGFRASARNATLTDLDQVRPPGSAMEILDCDGSQATALARIAAGDSLVIHGPPGTGKSQTIANLLADAVARGRRVLFVAEKLAALEVVKRRLDQSGLGALCLELHAEKASRTSVVEDLRATLQLGQPLPATAEDALVEALPGYRERLNAYARAVAATVPPTDLTPVQAVGHLERLRAAIGDLPVLPTAALTSLDPAGFRELCDAVAELARILTGLGCPSEHPFEGCLVLESRPGDEDAVRTAATSALAELDALEPPAAEMAGSLGLSPTATPAELERLLSILDVALAAPDLNGLPPVGAAWDDQVGTAALRQAVKAGTERMQLRQTWHDALLDEAWTADVRESRAAIALYGGSWWSRLFSGRYRAARRQLATLSQLPPIADPVRMLAACEAIRRAQEAEIVIAAASQSAGVRLGGRWLGVATIWPDTAAVLTWAAGWRAAVATHPQAATLSAWVVTSWERPRLAALVAALRVALGRCRTTWTALGRRLGHAMAEDQVWSDSTYATLRLVAGRWRDAAASLPAWVAYYRRIQHLRDRGQQALVAHAHDGSLAPEALVPACERAWAALALEQAHADRQALGDFDPAAQQRLIERFVAADRAVFTANRVRLARQHWTALPGEAGFGQVGILRRECAKKARHLPVRQLMIQAGAAVQVLKPIFMMSPLSVAALLPPGSVEFDLVVFDEASQVRPVDALGAIMRGRQLVVVGDEQQMPPTSFFDRLAGDAADDEATDSATADMPSILGLCLGQGLHQEMLRWHYRSRHDSLIALSNREFYGNDLVVFPSPGRSAAGDGVQLTYLPDTVYDRGGSRTNPLEADAVAAAVVEHLRTQPQRSLAVVAFSVAQRDAIEDRIEDLCRADPGLDALIRQTRPEEPFVVKNLENVQGDERDTIFISVGYGKDAAGQVTMNFGPLGQQGGERRLNVLITRARICCRVFTNLRHEDLDLRRAAGRGIEVFRHFLRFAAEGTLDQPTVVGQATEAPFEAAVSDELVRRGFTVERRVGRGGYRLDLAVVDPADPSRYLLGIMCDGAPYHGSQWARDRDRLREAVLRSLGWRLHQVWSTDWYRRREEAIQRLLADINAASKPSPALPNPAPAAVARDPRQPPGSRSRVVAYRPARVEAEIGDRHLADLAPAAFGRGLALIVADESPMHQDDLRRRVLESIGARSGTRRVAAIDAAVDEAVRLGLVRRDGEFLWNPPEHDVVPRDRSAMPEAARRPNMVCAREWQAAVLAVVDEAIGCTGPDEAAAQAVIALGTIRNDEAHRLADDAVHALLVAGTLVAEPQRGIHRPG